MSTFDVAVVGLGVLGSAAAYHAAKKGAKVIAFEQFELGHVRGASHDTSRIVRTSYQAEEYVALAKAAYRDWAELERESKQKLLTITGGVVFQPKGGLPSIEDYTQSLDANGIEYEVLDHHQVNRRWPQFKLTGDYDAVYTPDTGIAHANKSVAAMQWLAKFHGADLRERTRVTRIQPRSPAGSGVTIETSTGTFTARKVVLAADAWINDLLRPLGAEIPLITMQEQVTYFKPSQPERYEAAHFPVWIRGGKQWYYGFPCFGEPTIKAGHDIANNLMDPNQRTFVPSEKLLGELSGEMQQWMPDAGRQVLRTVTCQYAITPERQFILTPLEQHPDIIITMGAGHGFKFAPAIGRVAAELAIDGKTNENISKFNVPSSAVAVDLNAVQGRYLNTQLPSLKSKM